MGKIHIIYHGTKFYIEPFNIQFDYQSKQWMLRAWDVENWTEVQFILTQVNFQGPFDEENRVPISDRTQTVRE